MSLSKCNYTVSLGLIDMLSALTKTQKQEVWAQLSEETQVCINRLMNKNMRESWRWVKYPNTEIRLKIKVGAYGRRDNEGDKQVVYGANITMDSNQSERFTSEQVEDFLIGEILLG